MVGCTRGAVAVVLLAGMVACGKKGPPLAPIVRIPASIDQISARRLGGEVYVTLTVPARNVDDSTPVDISRIEVYGYTGRSAPPRTRWVELGTLVAMVPVQPEPAMRAQPDASAGPSAAPTGATPGTAVTIRDDLSPEEMQPEAAGAQPAVPGDQPEAPGVPPATAGSGPPPGQAGAAAAQLRRFYMALPFSPRGRPGPPGAVGEVLLSALPAPPPAPRVRFSEQTVTVEWDPPTAIPMGVTPESPLRYSVYRTLAPAGAEPPVPPTPWHEPAPTPLNAQPITAATLQDDVEFGRERCYTVRTVLGAGPTALEGVPSPRVCVTPIDIFPPESPSGLSTVAADGAITLLWESNSEADLAGYLVLRGEAGDDTLRPLTPMPIADATYRDTAVMPGQRYVYAVVAVDRREPAPNASAPSARVEETAR